MDGRGPGVPGERGTRSRLWAGQCLTSSPGTPCLRRPGDLLSRRGRTAEPRANAMRIPQKTPGIARWLAVLAATLAQPALVAGAPAPGTPPPGAITALTLPVSGMTCVLCT